MRSYKCLKCNEKMDESKYGLHEACFAEWFDAQANDEFTNIARRQSVSHQEGADEQNRAPWNSTFFHGKFLKYSADLSGKSYIIKLKENIAPELPHVEYLCNQIATELGILTPEYYCINYYEQSAFVTHNLLDKHKGIKTLNHIYHYIKSEQEYNCENLIKTIANETNSYSDIGQFIEICLFDSLIGNHDRHGRNLGFLVDSKKTILCPAYDNTSALGLESGKILGAQFNPSGKIATKDTFEPTAKDYIVEFSRLDYLDVTRNFVEKINIENIENIVQKSHCSDLMKKAIARLVLSRYQEMCDALQN